MVDVAAPVHSVACEASVREKGHGQSNHEDAQSSNKDGDETASAHEPEDAAIAAPAIKQEMPAALPATPVSDRQADAERINLLEDLRVSMQVSNTLLIRENHRLRQLLQKNGIDPDGV